MIVKNIYQPKNITKRVSKNDLKEYFVRDMGDSKQLLKNYLQLTLNCKN